MGYFVAIVLFSAGAFLFWKIAPKFDANRSVVLTGWILKLACSALFVWLYSVEGLDGLSIQGDAYKFYFDSGVLARYAEQDFGGYLKLLFGVHQNETQLVANELSGTNIWSFGDNGDLINDNRLIIRLNSIIHFFSFGNIYVHILIFSGLAYVGILLLYKTFHPFVVQKKFFLVALVAFPSVIFWTSGLTKETLSLFAIGLFLYALVQILFEKRNAWSFILLIISILLLLFNKPYVGLILIPVSALIVLGKLSGWKTKVITVFSVLVIGAMVTLSYTPEKINIVTKISNRQSDMINLARGGVFFVTDSSFCSFPYSYFDHFDTLPVNKIQVLKATSGECKLFGPNPFVPFTIQPSNMLYERYLVQEPSRTFFEITPINNSGAQLVKNIPQSLYNALVRSFYTDGTGIYSVPILFSNLLLLGILTWSFYNRKKLESHERFLVFFLFGSALFILLVIGWTTPVVGAIVRYKVPAEILIIIACSILLRPFKKIAS